MTDISHGAFPDSSAVLVARSQAHGEQFRIEELRNAVDLVRQFAPPGKWLEIGCGTGTMLAVIQEHSIDVEAIELNDSRRVVAIQRSGATVHARPIEELDFADNTFAAVTLYNVFSHLTHPRKTLERIHDLLMPGGVAFLHTSEIGFGVRKRHKSYWALGDHLFFLGDSTIEHYTESIGLSIEHRETVWMPRRTYSSVMLRAPGRSSLRNLAKSIILRTPLALPLARWFALNTRHRDNPDFASSLVLKKVR